jgi:flagellar motor switch protein FliM
MCADFILYVVVDAQIVFALLDDLLMGGQGATLCRGDCT